MTEKEIKMELAKAALIGGASIERTKEMLTWVSSGDKQNVVDLNDIKVSELEQYLGMSSVRFRNRCMENDIHSIGQLVRIGSRGFRALRLVGGGLIKKINEALSEHYGVEDW